MGATTPVKGFQAIEDAETEPVSSIGAKNWYESNLWVMEIIFGMKIGINAYLLVHPAQNSSEPWYIMHHIRCDAQYTTSRYYFELDGQVYMHRYQMCYQKMFSSYTTSNRTNFQLQ